MTGATTDPGLKRKLGLGPLVFQAVGVMVGAMVAVSALMQPLPAQATSVLLPVAFLIVNVSRLAVKRDGPPTTGGFEAHWSIPGLGAATSLVALATASLG